MTSTLHVARDTVVENLVAHDIIVSDWINGDGSMSHATTQYVMPAQSSFVLGDVQCVPWDSFSTAFDVIIMDPPWVWLWGIRLHTRMCV